MVRQFRLFLVVLIASFGAVHATDKQFSVVAEEYPPFTDARLKSKGWTYAVVAAAMESQGYSVTLTLLPWARALEESKRGKYDALLNAYWNEERTAFYNFSVPIGEVRSLLYRRADRTDIKFDGDLHTLTSLRFGVVRGYTISDEFDNASYLNKELLARTEQGLAMLKGGRIDVLASGDLANGSNLLQITAQEHPGLTGQIVPVGPPLSVQYLHVAVSKEATDAAHKLEDLNIGLRKIMLNGTYDKILKAHHVEQPR
ncbi:MAG: transporter substrate-binding domain-containing protein [Burkholderiales bacterium]|nr:transporter substrate-binding domain-containing protein [Burkholderiales bacterium]